MKHQEKKKDNFNLGKILILEVKLGEVL